MTDDRPRHQFARRLAEIRMRRGLTQSALALMVGTDQKTIARYESGQVEPGVSRFFEISVALQVPAGELLGEDGPG